MAFVCNATSAYVYVGTNTNGYNVWYHMQNIPETTITVPNIQTWRIYGHTVFKEIQIHDTMHDDATVQGTCRNLVQKWKL